MKKLDTTPIATGISFIPKGGTLLFLQLAYQEAFNALMQGNIGSSYDVTKGYILYGCVNTGSGTTYTISAGAVFFNGEIYLVDAITFTISGSNVAEGTITTTQYTADADPSVFTDGVSRNVHNIRKIVFGPALAGSGAFDYVNAVNLAYRPVGAIGQTVLWQMPGSGSQNSLLATYFSSGVGIHPLTLGWEIDPLYSGYVPAGYSGTSPYDTLGQQQGANTHTISANDLPQLETRSKFAGTPGSSTNGYATVSVGSNSVEDVNPGSPNNPISLMQPTTTGLFIKRIS